MTQLIVVRHGQTEWNATDRVQGQSDVDLDDVGVAQAVEVAPRLAEFAPSLIVSSDLRRAVRTADALAAILGLPIELDPRLRERHFGRWQGLTMAEVRERYPAQHAEWAAGAHVTDPSVETTTDLAERTGAAFSDVARRVGGGTAVVVSHGGASRLACARMLGWPEAIWPTLGVLGNCRYAWLGHSAERGWRLRAYNVG
jgi:broad specificity phosphatase PhoE